MKKLATSLSGNLLAMVVALLLLGGCVTSTTSPYAENKDRARAVEANINLGLEYIKRNNMERARKKLNRALELDPNSAGAHAALGLVYQREGENVLAEQQFRKSLELDPAFTRGRTYYAAFLYAQGRYKEALGEFRKASEDTEFPSRAQVFANMGLCAEKTDDKEAAIQAYEKSLVLNPRQPEMRLKLVKLYIDMGKFEPAQLHFNQFLQMVASQPQVTHTPFSLYLGIQLATHFGDHSLSRSYAGLLESLFPESPEFRLYQERKAND